MRMGFDGFSKNTNSAIQGGFLSGAIDIHRWLLIAAPPETALGIMDRRYFHCIQDLNCTHAPPWVMASHLVGRSNNSGKYSG